MHFLQQHRHFGPVAEEGPWTESSMLL